MKKMFSNTKWLMDNLILMEEQNQMMIVNAAMFAMMYLVGLPFLLVGGLAGLIGGESALEQFVEIYTRIGDFVFGLFG